MEMEQMVIELEIALDGANLTWAHGILLCLTCISLIAVTFNRWIKNNGGKSPLKAINMVKVELPFSISLENRGRDVNVISSVVNKVEVYWDFHLKQFYSALTRRWKKNEPTLKSSTWTAYISDNSEEKEKTFRLYSHQVVRYSVPRVSYPVAVIVSNLKKTLQFREILGLIAVIDLGDPSREPPQAKIVGRYLKLGSGKVTPLERFFSSGLCQDNSTDICVVCRDSPVTRVALPCKHGCFCASCFDKVEKCSMCTSEINTYFCIEPALDDVD